MTCGTRQKEELSRVYSDSICLENLANMISEFEKVNTYSKYRTDLEEFIKESQFEDFYTDDRETVFVSTIHKSRAESLTAFGFFRIILYYATMPNGESCMSV